MGKKHFKAALPFPIYFPYCCSHMEVSLSSYATKIYDKGVEGKATAGNIINNLQTLVYQPGQHQNEQ